MAECPLKVVPREAWNVIGLAELYRRGVPPVAGGALDQAHAFNEAARFVWGEMETWRMQAAGPMAALMALLG